MPTISRLMWYLYGIQQKNETSPFGFLHYLRISIWDVFLCVFFSGYNRCKQTEDTIYHRIKFHLYALSHDLVTSVFYGQLPVVKFPSWIFRMYYKIPSKKISMTSCSYFLWRILKLAVHMLIIKELLIFLGGWLSFSTDNKTENP